MSRNRMKNSQSLHWMGVIKWILIAGLLSVLGLSYMLCKNQNLHLAAETLHLEGQLNSIEKRNSELAYDLASMQSPSRLQKRLALMHSNLVRITDGVLAVYPMQSQGARAVLARRGTTPSGPLDFDPSVVSTVVPPNQSSP